MHKGAVAVFTAFIIAISVLSAPVAAHSSVRIGIAAGYFKGSDAYDIVVHEKRGTKLVLYVNDKEQYQATSNKKNWATFHRVKLSGSGKISFAKVVRGDDHKTYRKPINYSRRFTASDDKVSFSKIVAAKPTPAPKPAPAPAPAPTPSCTNGSYVNSSGNTVCSPEPAPSPPAGATAQCADGTYSFSQHRSGTCSHHGGVAQWLY